MNKHYVCNGGCNGVSDTEGVCGAETCAKHGQPLLECSCQDGMHEGIVTPCVDCGNLCKENNSEGCKA
ncbi:MAG: hypothetical protein KBC17_00400 [Candidatus Pacebacteria bacterium]|nr:hypothetical protein [Candidatus Paceibacterota bacterium]